MCVCVSAVRHPNHLLIYIQRERGRQSFFLLYKIWRAGLPFYHSHFIERILLINNPFIRDARDVLPAPISISLLSEIIFYLATVLHFNNTFEYIVCGEWWFQFYSTLKPKYIFYMKLYSDGRHQRRWSAAVVHNHEMVNWKFESLAMRCYE